MREPPTGGDAAEPPLALSVDVEDYYQVQAFAHIVPREAWSTFPSRVVRNTRRLLDLFDESGAKGTFFVLGWVARAEPGLVREIAARGHEVASHGMDHRMLTELRPAELLAQARESRALLEDLAQAPVLGFRAPSYSVGKGTLWAIGVLAEAGYAYDSSVYPIRRRRYGYPEGPTLPARIESDGASIVEFPLPTLPVGPVRLPVLAGAYLRLLPAWVSARALDWHIARRLPVILNVHPWEVDPGQPTVGPSRRRVWTHYTGLAKTEGVLRDALRRGPFRAAATRLRELGLLPAAPVGAAR